MAVGMEQAGGSRRRHGRETLRAPCWHIKHKPSSGGRHRPTLLCAPVRQQVALRLAGKVESSLWTDARALPEVRAWPAVQRDNAERLRQRAGQLKPGALLERAWVWAAAEAIVEAGAAAAPGIVVTAVRPTNLESAVNLRAARQRGRSSSCHQRACRRPGSDYSGDRNSFIISSNFTSAAGIKRANGGEAPGWRSV